MIKCKRMKELKYTEKYPLIRVNSDIYKIIKQHSKQTHRTMSNTIRIAIKLLIDNKI